MNAALVESFDSPPVYREFQDPVPSEGDQVVFVRAAALSQLTKGRASGRHYSAGSTLPIVPGADGVGRLADGRTVYFLATRSPYGSMAEISVVSPDSFIELPEGLDPAMAAAIANPAMSSWAALTVQAHLARGETVLVHGATGAAGQLATKIAKHLGAGKVIAVGRMKSGLANVAADRRVDLDLSPEIVKAELKDLLSEGVHVVLDYLWGAPAELLLEAMSGSSSPKGEPIVRYVQIGAIAGSKISFAAESLRSSGIRMMGSGLGSVSRRDLVASISGAFQASRKSDLSLDIDMVALSDVSEAWNRDVSPKRLVFVV